MSALQNCPLPLSTLFHHYLQVKFLNTATQAYQVTRFKLQEPHLLEMKYFVPLAYDGFEMKFQQNKIRLHKY